MIRVVDIPIFAGSPIQASAIFFDCCKKSESNNLLISATGAHGVVTAKKRPEFRDLLNEFFINLPDGMPIVWIGRLQGDHNIRRCYGPEFFEIVMRQSAGMQIRHFLCGGKKGVVEDLQMVCLDRFGNPNVVGTYTPPFRELTHEEMGNLGDTISASRADVVWVGLSTPKQEFFAARLREFVQVKFIVAVGAAFDFHTGRIPQTPRWMQHSGLEWFYRLLSEPRRLSRRYFVVVPLFLYYGIQHLLKFWLKRTNV